MAQVVGTDIVGPAVSAQRLREAARVVLAPGVRDDEEAPGGNHLVVQHQHRIRAALGRADEPETAIEVHVLEARAFYFSRPASGRREHQEARPRLRRPQTSHAGALMRAHPLGDGDDQAVVDRHRARLRPRR